MMRFSVAALPATIWKNGGGVTREIVVFPPGASLDEFDWRISVASISASGPFSTFPGIDRVIMLLDGDGVELSGHTIHHRLDRVGVPFEFSGDEALHCTLLGASSSDFNVMSRRARLKAKVDIIESNRSKKRGSAGLVMSVSGRWQVNEHSLEAGDGLWWSKEGETLVLQTLSPEKAQLVLVRLEPEQR